MKRASTSLDLSEFFNDDDSEGDRLVEFIQKKRGVLKRQNFLFMNDEPQRFSLNVQLEKLPTSDQADKNQKERNSNIQLMESLGRGCISFSSLAEAVAHIPSSEITNAVASQPPCISNSLMPQPLSPRLNSLRKSGGVSANDCLRRYSLKKLTKFSNGRRTLLQEFENTMGDFNFKPPVCSTPLAQSQPVKSPSALNCNQAVEEDARTSSLSTNDPAKSGSCCNHTDKLIKCLQRKDKELKNYIDETIQNMQVSKENNNNVINRTINKTPLNNSNSTLKRTYTLKKGTIPGEVILTLDKSTADRQGSRLENSQGKSLQVKEGNLSKQEQKKTVEELQTGNLNVSAIPQKQQVEISEMQNQNDASSNCIIIQSNQKTPVVLIPVIPSATKTYNNENGDNRNGSKIISFTLATQTTRETYEKNDIQWCQQTEDNLKLSDVLTDDEDGISQSQTAEGNSQLPLNLAPIANNLRTKCLRKSRFPRRKLNVQNSQQPCSEIETDHPIQNNKRMLRKKCIPLNSAPGMPLNGEKFAKELTRMSNYEIIDLRKRNSMGEVFSTSSGKSTRSHKEVLKKQLQLDNEILNEIVRRKNCENEEQKLQNDSPNVEYQDNVDEHVPVPNEFRDSMAIQEEIREICESSLIDDEPSERVSFNKTKNVKNTNKKLQPEELKKYLRVTKILSKRKSKAKYISKRALYSQGDYETTESNSEENLTLQQKSSCYIESSIPCVPAPPKSDGDLITTPKVVSPPPPLCMSPQNSVTQEIIRSDVLETLNDNRISDIENTTMPLPPPPSAFDNDADVHINNSNNESSNRTIQTTGSFKTTGTNANTKNDDHLFKIPDRPAPRKGRRRADKLSSNGLLERTINSQQSNNYSTDTTGGTLRRSKRGHVPLKYPIFQILFEQMLNRQLKTEEKKMERQKEVAKMERQNNKKSISEKSSKSSKKASNKQLPKGAENDKDLEAFEQEPEMITKSRTKKRNKKSKKISKPVTNFENTSLIRNNSPIDELNSMFDQLKNSTLPQAPLAAPLKVKPLRIRVARLKNSIQPNSCNDSVSTTSSSINKSSNDELILWLKSITDSQGYNAPNVIFKHLRVSAAANLSFTELQGIEYAFYNTDESGSFGYLRFKPRQIKPKKRAKLFQLHFLSLTGAFRITANDVDSRIGVGDLAIIEKLVYYDIENITDDIAILLVFKK